MGVPKEGKNGRKKQMPLSSSADFLPLVPPFDWHFRTHESFLHQLEMACSRAGSHARYHEIGRSEEGRPLLGVTLGSGPHAVSLIAGAHADEPVGPETLRFLLLEILSTPERYLPLLRTFRFFVVPHVNPDGEARNHTWIAQWPSFEAYLRHRMREQPGRDVEFGFPDARPENRAVAAYLASGAPFMLHMSLHGMGYSEGALLLIDKHWIDRTSALRQQWLEHTCLTGLRPHDQNREGEKGFHYLGPGFWTTPESAAMKAYFLARNDPEMAARFRLNSMEYVRQLGGNPLCLVTELPLFLLSKPYIHQRSGIPELYQAFNRHLPEVHERVARGLPIDDTLASFGLQPLPLPVAMHLQLIAIQLGLETAMAATV